MRDLSNLKSKVRDWVRASKSLKYLALAFLLAITLTISLYCLRTTPDFWFDEGIYYQIVENWASQGRPGVAIAPGVASELSLISVGYSVFYPAVLIFKLFGAGVFTLRLVGVAFLLGFVAVFYVFARRLYGRQAAFWSTLLLITFSPLYGNGKSFLGEVPGLFYFLLGLFFFWRYEDKSAAPAKTGVEADRESGVRLTDCLAKRPVFNLFGAGIFFGLAISAKPIYILIGPAVVLALLAGWRHWFGSRSGRLGLGVLALGLIGPLFLWINIQFGSEVSLARILSHYSNPYYFSDWTSVILGNLKRFFTESTPAHFLLLLGLALVYFVAQIGKRVRLRLVEIVVLAFCLLVGLAYLRTLGWYRNFFPAHALLFLFAWSGFIVLYARLEKWTKVGVHTVPIVAGALLLAQLFPLSTEALSCKIDAPTAIAPLMQGLPSTESILFYSVPQIAARSGHNNYYQYIKMSDELSLGAENLPRLADGFFGVVIIEEAATRVSGVIPDCYQLASEAAGIQFYRRHAGSSC